MMAWGAGKTEYIWQAWNIGRWLVLAVMLVRVAITLDVEPTWANALEYALVFLWFGTVWWMIVGGGTRSFQGLVPVYRLALVALWLWGIADIGTSVNWYNSTTGYHSMAFYGLFGLACASVGGMAALGKVVPVAGPPNPLACPTAPHGQP